jgi:hypothetical protein
METPAMTTTLHNKTHSTHAPKTQNHRLIQLDASLDHEQIMNNFNNQFTA